LATLFLFQSAAAQEQPLLDTIRAAFQNKGSFVIGLDGRNSFVGATPARVYGFRLGLDYGKVRVYTGLYTLGRKIQGQGYTLPGDTVRTYLNFSYWSNTFDLMLYQDKKWELGFPVQIGAGIGYRERFRNSVSESRNRPFFIPIEAQFTAIYRLTRYIGLSAGLGFRVSTLRSSSFNGTTYYYGLTFFSGTFYRDLKKKNLI
jgi:hypothetical protein